MKISFDIDCTPEEARRFFGLPDMKALQDSVVEELQKSMLKTIQTSDGKALLDSWMQSSVNGMNQVFGETLNNANMNPMAMSQPNLEQMQQFWQTMMQQAMTPTKGNEKS